MPKQKTHKGSVKRIRVTARGKVARKKAGSGHLMSTKSGNRCRQLGKNKGMTPVMTKKTRLALGE